MLLQLNTKELPPNFEPFIVGAHGNPGYLKEVVLNLQQRGLLTQENGEWRLECSDVEEALPSTLKAFISSRIDLLPLPAQTCLKIGTRSTPFVCARLRVVTWSYSIGHRNECGLGHFAGRVPAPDFAPDAPGTGERSRARPTRRGWH